MTKTKMQTPSRPTSRATSSCTKSAGIRGIADLVKYSLLGLITIALPACYGRYAQDVWESEHQGYRIVSYVTIDRIRWEGYNWHIRYREFCTKEGVCYISDRSRGLVAEFDSMPNGVVALYANNSNGFPLSVEGFMHFFTLTDGGRRECENCVDRGAHLGPRTSWDDRLLDVDAKRLLFAGEYFVGNQKTYRAYVMEFKERTYALYPYIEVLLGERTRVPAKPRFNLVTSKMATLVCEGRCELWVQGGDPADREVRTTSCSVDDEPFISIVDNDFVAVCGRGA